MYSHLYACERCQECLAGKTYRVLSENDGEKLLDMLVCHGCYIEASRLGLDAEAVEGGQIALH
jgi:coenzyme F420-reducing hydrogenase beta subunit